MIVLSDEIKIIQTLLQPDEKYYIVGGMIRDTLLSRQSQDIDIVCSGDSYKIAKKLADKLSGSFFVLDAERNACRVIANNGQGKKVIVDFTRLRGDSIDDDLKERDFTINAMAVDLANSDSIIDPLSGGNDLMEKKLQPCSDSCFLDDPLRVIRAIRYSVKYDLHIETKTQELIRQAVKGLPNVSVERKRDELFKLLDNKKPWVSLQLLSHFGILQYIGLEAVSQINEAVSRLRILDHQLAYLEGANPSSGDEYFQFASFISGFKNSRPGLRDHITQVNQSDRSKKGLDKLAAILWDLDEGQWRPMIKEMALSVEEQNHLEVVLHYRDMIVKMVESQTDLDSRTVYRFFKKTGKSGIDLVLLSLAEKVNCLSSELDETGWLALLQVCQSLVETWFGNPEVISPEPFLTGRDLMFEFDIPQGPCIGTLLDGLVEEQAAGEIKTRKEALIWVERQIQRNFITQ